MSTRELELFLLVTSGGCLFVAFCIGLVFFCIDKYKL